MEDVSSQSCRRHRGDGPVRGANHLVPVVIWPVDHGAQPKTDPVAWRYRASNRRVDRQSTHGGMRLGAPTRLSDPRPGCLLRQRVHPPPPLSRHSRSPDIATLTLAKWLCGAVDRLDPAGVCLDHVVVFGERHLRDVLSCYINYYNAARTHLSLDKDTSKRDLFSAACITNTLGFD